MESGTKLQLIDQAIQKLLAEKRKKQASSDGLLQDDNEQILLSKFLSELELESLKGQDTREQSESSAEQEVNSPAFKMQSKGEKASQVDGGCTETGTEEIMKEIRKVKRQNIATHCLLSVMIVLNVAWQLSEVSLILKVKDGLSHPFKSFGSVLTGMIKPLRPIAQDVEKQQTEAPSVPVPFPPVNMNLTLDGEIAPKAFYCI